MGCNAQSTAAASQHIHRCLSVCRLPLYHQVHMLNSWADQASCAGLYADLDFEVLQPFDGLVKGQSLVLASMTDDLTFNHSIPNAWMASAPGHRFWQFCLQHIVSAASPCLLQPKKG